MKMKNKNFYDFSIDIPGIYAIIQKLVRDHATSYGGIAQLGERLNGIQEVSGSIPLISTKNPENHRFSGFFFAFLVELLLIN